MEVILLLELHHHPSFYNYPTTHVVSCQLVVCYFRDYWVKEAEYWVGPEASDTSASRHMSTWAYTSSNQDRESMSMGGQYYAAFIGLSKNLTSIPDYAVDSSIVNYIPYSVLSPWITENWITKIIATNNPCLTEHQDHNSSITEIRKELDVSKGIYIPELIAQGYTHLWLFTNDRFDYNGYMYYVSLANRLGGIVHSSIPNITGTFGEFQYSGTAKNSAPFAYTADSTAKVGGTSAKNKGYVTMNMNTANELYGYYQSVDSIIPDSLCTQFFIKY